MRKLVCDRCKKEIHGWEICHTIQEQKSLYTTKYYDLCGKCSKEFYKFINNKEYQEEENHE